MNEFLKNEWIKAVKENIYLRIPDLYIQYFYK